MVTCAAAAPARADLPLWELGAGAAALRVPHYRGSEQSHHWLLPIPCLVFRGEILRSDREGTRAVLLDTDRVDLDLSLDGSPPASSSDNRARAGMPDLAPTVEFGPKLNVRLGKGDGWRVNLRLPLRAGFALGKQHQQLGWTLQPVLNLDVRWRGWNLGVQGGPLAASRRWHAYFYDVAAPYATADRPAYAARGGYAGWALASSATRRIGDWWLAGFVRVDSLAGATFVTSPLVTQRSKVTFGVALSRVFMVSDERVAERS
jgi:outer membrane scaffolding protein for murein synthesis (MipA/OmpV family)